jgi:parvulin-like peptidyl-prolyl isomerase
MSGKIFPIILLYLIFAGCQRGPEEIARVGSLVISSDDIKTALNSRYPEKENYRDLDLAKKEEILNNLIRNKLKLNAAYAEGLDVEKKIVKNIEEYRDKLIISRYHEKIVIDQLVPPEEVERFINNQKYEIKVSHILITYRELNPRVTRSMEEARNLADDIYQKLKGGADFTEMAVKYSDDQSAKSNKGSLSYFTWGSMVPEFEEAAWSLKIGEISKPVKTRFGFHIIRLEDKRERKGFNPPSDEEGLFYIKRQLFMTHGDSGRVLWEKHLADLKERYDFESNKQNILAIATTITKNMNEGRTDIQALGRSELQMVLAEWRGGKITVEDLFSADPDRTGRALVRYKQAHFVEEDVDSQGIRKVILADAKAKGISEDPYLKGLVEKFRETQLLQNIEKLEINDKSEATPDEARAYYEAHPNEFMKPAELELWEIFVKDESVAKSVFARAQKGENFEKLAKKYNVDKKYEPQNGYVGYVAAGARGSISKEAFALGPGNRIGGPLKYSNGWIIFKTGRKKESVLRKFEEVDDRAKSLVRRELLNERRKIWEDSLKNVYQVAVDTTKLGEI